MKMRRNVVRLNREHLVRLDEISEFASGVLDREVSRAAVIRAALDEWLASRAELSPGDVVESILSGIVKRGRLSFEEIEREKATTRAPVRKRLLHPRK